jgi:hypothetical protein
MCNAIDQMGEVAHSWSMSVTPSMIIANAANASSGPLVFVNDAAQDVSTDGPFVANSRGHRAGEWHVELDTSVGSGFVVVTDVLAENDLEMSLRDNQQVVETVLSDSPHKALGEGIRPRRGDRGLDSPDSDGGKNGVEAGDELGIPVPDEESEAASGLFEFGAEVAGHLGDPGTVGMVRHPEQVHPSTIDLDDEEHVEAPECDRVDGEEVGGQDARGLCTQELAPSGT